MKKTKNKIYFIISAILLISIIMIKPNNAVSYSTGIIEMETDKNEIEIGGTFTISVLVKPGTTQRSITSTNAVLTYNSDVVQCIKTNQAYNERTGNIELKNEDGKISYSYDANAMYALGNTKLFTATFKVISYGKIQMNLVYNSKEGNRGEILNNQRRTVNIKLNVKLENIELNENEITIEKGCQRKLIVKYKPEETTDNKTIIWSSSNENVATVNQDGTVCAVSEGKCIVTAECNGKKAECEVYVCKKKIELKSIDIGKDITLEKEVTYQLKIKYNPENTTESKSAIYESSNSHIAIVDDTGKIVAKNEGIAYITVKVNNLSSMIKVTVYTRNDKEDSSTTKNDKEDNSNTKDDKESNSETKNDNENKNNQTENNKTPEQSKNNDKSNDRNNNSSYKPNNTNNSSKNNMASNKNNRNNSNVNNIKNNVSNLEENIERETNSILQNQEQNNNVENELAENQINNNTQEVSANIVETSKPNYTWIVVIIVMGIIIIIFLFVYLKLSRSKH
jgi:uncharacterized protein YjdB